MNSREATLQLVQNTLNKIQKEAEEKKHQTIYDLLEFKHFPYPTELITFESRNRHKKMYGIEKFSVCVDNLLQIFYFRRFATRVADQIIEAMSEEDIIDSNYNLVISYLLIFMGYADSAARANLATIDLLSQGIQRKIHHFAALASSNLSHQYLVIGDCPMLQEQKFPLDEFISEDCIVFDPTLYIIGTHREFRERLQEKFPLLNTMSLMKTSSSSPTNRSQANLIVQTASQLIQKISQLGYDFKDPIKMVTAAYGTIQLLRKAPSVLEQKKTLTDSIKNHDNEIKPITKSFKFNIQQNSSLSNEYKECDDAFKTFTHLQTTWFKESLKILLNTKTLSSESPKKIRKDFLKEYFAFKKSISSLSTTQQIEKATLKFNTLKQVWTELKLEESYKKSNDLIEQYNKKSKDLTEKPNKSNEQKNNKITTQNILTSLIAARVPIKEFHETHAAFKKLCEEYKSVRKDLETRYQDTNIIYQSLYNNKEYKRPDSLDQKDPTEPLKREVDEYVVSTEHLKKIEEHIKTVTSLKHNIENDISHFKQLKVKYQKKKAGPKDTLAAHTTTAFSKKKPTKPTSAPAAPSRANKFYYK